MLEHIKADLFDLDGTLVDSMWVWNDIDVEYLGRFGLSLPETLQKEIEGMSFTETAVYIKQKFSIPDPIEKMKEDWNAMAFDKYVNEVPLKKGVPEFLALCRKKGIRLGIATSNSRQLVDAIIASHGLTEYFDGIVTGKPWEAVAGCLSGNCQKMWCFTRTLSGFRRYCSGYAGGQKCRYEGMCCGRCLFGLSGKRKA